MKVHTFTSTGDAYDETQCNENIANGDILVIESEGVVGIADTWPFAITQALGQLHRFKDEIDVPKAIFVLDQPLINWQASFDEAKRIALEKGFKISSTLYPQD